MLRSTTCSCSRASADAEYLLTVDGIGMLAKGDIQAVKGKAKQGKTFFITALVAAVLNGKFGALKVSGEDYRVLIVDTEQNMKNVARNARKIHRLCGWPENENHPRFSAVALRGYNTDERLCPDRMRGRQSRFGRIMKNQRCGAVGQCGYFP